MTSFHRLVITVIRNVSVCVCVCVRACVRVCVIQYVRRQGARREEVGERELWADPVVCPITMSEGNEQIDNDL